MSIATHALNQYRQSGINSGVHYADPHTLVNMLYNGLRERLAIAKGAILHKNNAGKGEALGRAIEIIGYLQACLDMEKGGEISNNLDALYDYMTRRLFDATSQNDAAAIDEVMVLIQEISTAWAAINEQVSVADKSPTVQS
jgi:flagellar secretion chaperone FliS